MTSQYSVLTIRALFIMLFIASISVVPAYPEYVSESNNSIAGGMENTSPSMGANIVILQHLIEIDQASYSGYLKVDETIVYKNMGTENYTGPIYVWVQDKSFNISVRKLEMMMDSQTNPIEVFSVHDNTVGWNDTIQAALTTPPMYRIEYMVPAENNGEMAKSITFTKKLNYPPLINYTYISSTGMPALVIRLVKSDEMEAAITNAEGNRIEADSMEVGTNIEMYNWAQPRFTEISLTVSPSTSQSSNIVLYLLIFVVVIGIISYPLLRRKSPALKGKLESVIPKEQDEDLYWETEEEEFEKAGEPDYEDDATKEPVSQRIPGINDIDKLDIDELQAINKALSKVLFELDEDYAKGTISEDEYNTIRDKYHKKNIDIMEKIDILKRNN